MMFPLSQCKQLEVQEWVTSKETTSGRSVRKLHVPREIMRAARPKGIAFTLSSENQSSTVKVSDEAKVDGRIFRPYIPGRCEDPRTHRILSLNPGYKAKLPDGEKHPVEGVPWKLSGVPEVSESPPPAAVP